MAFLRFLQGASFLDGADDAGEVVVGEHHAGGLLAGLGAFDAHRDADVGALEGGGVVHAVAGHGDDSPRSWSRWAMRSLCSGATRAKTSNFGRGRPKVVIAHAVEFLSADGRLVVAVTMPRFAPIARAVLAWSPVIMTGRMPALPALADGLDGFLAGRVDHALDAKEGQAGGGLRG